MNVSLTSRLEAFVKRKVNSGLYNNASEVVREALRLLCERDGAAGQSPETPPRKDEVVSTLRELRGELNGRGIVSAALFGSVLRGDAKTDSDIDVLIDVNPDAKFSLTDLVAAKHFLEDRLARPVDLVTRGGLAPALEGAVLSEAERAF